MTATLYTSIDQVKQDLNKDVSKIWSGYIDGLEVNEWLKSLEGYDGEGQYVTVDANGYYFTK